MSDWTPMEKAKPEKGGWYWTTDIKGEVRLLHYEAKHTDFHDEYEDEWYSFKYIVAWIMIDKPDPYEPPMTEAEAATLIGEIASSYHERMNKALILAQEALEKRIPKEVDGNQDNCYRCPQCRKPIVDEARFCWYCGQALEWEDWG